MLFVFNKRVDLLEGDIWESILSEEVDKYIYTYPEGFRLLAIGTTTNSYRMGEIMGWGAVSNPDFLWANPEHPYRVQRIQSGEYPWMQLALFDPNRELGLKLKETKDLHAKITERLRHEGMPICALHVEARTSRVRYSLTNWIPKIGRDRNLVFQEFQEKKSAPWVFYGIYVDDERGPSCGMVPGQPLLMVGYNLDTKNGGLVKFAEVQNAKIHYYPINDHRILQSDLTIDRIYIHEDRVAADIQNIGQMTAKHVRIRLTLPDSGREMDAVFPVLKPQGKTAILFRLQKSPEDKTIFAEIDPNNDILESNEENNRLEAHL